MDVRVAPLKCRRPRPLFVMARVSVQKLVALGTPTMSLAMAVAPAAAPARSELRGLTPTPFFGLAFLRITPLSGLASAASLAQTRSK